MRKSEACPDSTESELKPEQYKEVYDEMLMQLKGLLDDGIITQEEFEAKKKELL